MHQEPLPSLSITDNSGSALLSYYGLLGSWRQRLGNSWQSHTFIWYDFLASSGQGSCLWSLHDVSQIKGILMVLFYVVAADSNKDFQAETLPQRPCCLQSPIDFAPGKEQVNHFVGFTLTAWVLALVSHPSTPWSISTMHFLVFHLETVISK